jgi:hypothetical protein
MEITVEYLHMGIGNFLKADALHKPKKLKI